MYSKRRCRSQPLLGVAKGGCHSVGRDVERDEQGDRVLRMMRKWGEQGKRKSAHGFPRGSAFKFLGVG